MSRIEQPGHSKERRADAGTAQDAGHCPLQPGPDIAIRLDDSIAHTLAQQGVRHRTGIEVRKRRMSS